MRALSVLFLSLALVAPSVSSVAAPAKPQAQAKQQSSLDRLFAQLARAGSDEEAEGIRKQIFASFLQSGSASIDLLMVRAGAAFSSQDGALARQLLDAVTRIAPNFAEGWRQRAALQAAAGGDRGAMISLQKTIALNPRHFAAMMDLANLLDAYGDKAGALTLTRRALSLDPRMEGGALQERSLKKDVEGQDI